jgi:serine protease
LQPSGRIGGAVLRRLCATAAALSLASMVGCGAGHESPPEAATAQEVTTTDRLIVQYRSGSDGARRRAMAAPTATTAALQRAGVSVQAQHRNALGAHVLHLSREHSVADLQALATRLKSEDPTIEFAEPDLRMHAAAIPTDPLYAQQWHYFDPVGGLHLPDAWDLASGSGVVVAVIDTGVRPHADLVDRLLSGHDFVTSADMANDGDGRDGDASDPGDGCNGARSSWHGTHVAGTIAASQGNDLGGTGVAPGAQVLPVRVLGCGGGYMSDIADGIVWASGGSVADVPDNATPARVLNLSLGGSGTCSATMQAAINGARDRGSLLVVAAGNSSREVATSTPANCRGVVVVAATGSAGGRAPYSNFGSAVDLAAPGGQQSRGTAWGVLSTYNDGYSSPGNDSHGFLQGTSMATPHVAGVAALMRSRHPSLTPDEVEALLKSTTRAFPASCKGCGTGIVHAARAVGSVFLGATQATDLAEVEPNHTLALSQVLSGFPVRLSGQVETSKDIDHYKVSLPAGSTLTARLIGHPSANLDLALRTRTGTIRATSTRGAGLADVINFRQSSASAADYHLRVVRTSGGTGANATYTLEVKVE